MLIAVLHGPDAPAAIVPQTWRSDTRKVRCWRSPSVPPTAASSQNSSSPSTRKHRSPPRAVFQLRTTNLDAMLTSAPDQRRLYRGPMKVIVRREIDLIIEFSELVEWRRRQVRGSSDGRLDTRT